MDWRRLSIPITHGALLAVTALLLFGAGEAALPLAAVLATGVAVLGVELLVLIREARDDEHEPARLPAPGAAWGVLVLPWLGLELLGYWGTPFPRSVWGLIALTAVYALLSLRWLRLGVRGEPSRTHEWLRRLALVVLAGCVTLIAVESALRPFLPEFPYEITPDAGSPAQYARSDDALGTRLVPGFHGRFRHWDFPGLPVTINRDGFRDREWPATPADDWAVRLLGLGDSFAFGTGVRAEQVFLRRLEAAPDLPRPVRCFNAGVPGYGTAQQALLLERLAPRLAPDAVVLLLYTGNDLEETLRSIRRRQPAGAGADGRPTAHDSRPPWRRGERRHVTGAVRDLARGTYWAGTSALGQLVLPRVHRLLVRVGWAHPRVVYNDFLIRSCARTPDPEVAEAEAAVVAAVKRAADLCAARGARLVVVLAPPAVLVDRSMFEHFFESQQAYRRERFDADVLHQRLGGRLELAGVATLDLLGPLRQLHAAGVATYHDEGHWNAAGHQLAADALAGWLVESGWLRPAQPEAEPARPSELGPDPAGSP